MAVSQDSITRFGSTSATVPGIGAWIRAPRKRIAESNVRHDPRAARIAYGAAWDVTMAPLDTAGGILLAGKLYARVRDSKSPLCRALMENYRIWGPKVNWDHAEEHSSGLFDPVAFSLIVRPEFLQLEDMRLKVTEKGMTVPDPEGKLIHVAIRWKDLGGFFRFIAERLSAPYKPLRPKSARAEGKSGKKNYSPREPRANSVDRME